MAVVVLVTSTWWFLLWVCSTIMLWDVLRGMAAFSTSDVLLLSHLSRIAFWILSKPPSRKILEVERW
jgi:hypothetical protein